MRSTGLASAIGAVVAGLVVTASLVGLMQTRTPPPTQAGASLTIWQAYARGLVSIAMVNLTFHRGGSTVTEPAGIRVTNGGNEDVVIPEEAVLMSPHPGQQPPPDPMNTTQDAVLTNATISAGSSLTYSYGLYVLQGFLSGPTWWCLEEMHFSKAGIAFALGGETLPFALRPLVEHPFFVNVSDNSQTAIWSYFRHDATVVVEKLPLAGDVNASGGDRVPIRLDATNMAVWSTDDNVTANVNVTGGVLEDDVATGWSVDPASYSLPPSEIVNHPDGSKTIRWLVNISAAPVSDSGNPEDPTPFTTKTVTYTLVAPVLNASSVDLARARFDLNNTGSTDAHSAPIRLTVHPATPPPGAGLARAKIGVRLAGEPGGAANLTVHGNGTALAALTVKRTTDRGGPDLGFTPLLTFNLSVPVNLTLVYTPGGKSSRGASVHGDNPAWIIVKFPDSTEVVFFHNFNAQHPTTWRWTSGDLRPVFQALNETFVAGAGSPSVSASSAKPPASCDNSVLFLVNTIVAIECVVAALEGQRVI